jgi:hypothetical protein
MEAMVVNISPVRQALFACIVIGLCLQSDYEKIGFAPSWRGTLWNCSPQARWQKSWI